LPWKGWKKKYVKFDPKSNPSGNWVQCSKSSTIIKLIEYISNKRPDIKNIVIDDVQYSMCFEFMDRRKEKGYEKFNDIGGDFTDLLRVTDNIRDDIKLIFTAHSENKGSDMDPYWTLKTIGKMVSEKVTPEGLFTYVFHAIVEEGDNGMEYKFLTNTDGAHVAKTPLGMFEEQKIDNDVNEILKVIDKYENGDE
jgi:hypothetical protein